MEIQSRREEAPAVDIRIVFDNLEKLVRAFREAMPEGVLDEYSQDPIWNVVEEFKRSNPSELIRVPGRNGNRYMTLAHHVSVFFVNSVCRNLAADTRPAVMATDDGQFIITTPEKREQIRLAISRVVNLVNTHLGVPVEIDGRNGNFIVK